MSFSNVRIPPDSSGKRLLTLRTVDLSYLSGTSDFSTGDRITGETSGAFGDIAKVTGTTISGILSIVMDPDSADFQDAENLQVGGITFAVSTGTGTEGHAQNVSLIGANNHKNAQFVDNKGSAFIRFAQGDAGFDGFGNLKVGIDNPIASYFFNYEDKEGTNTLRFQTKTTGSASKAHSVLSGSVTLTNTTSATDSISRMSNRYHIAIPGGAMDWIGGVKIGDTGKANVTRRWGYYSDLNGAFFELNGTSLSVGYRNPTTGIPVDITVPQSQWNIDKADGSGGLENKSGLNLDVSKWNMFIITMQFMTAAEIIFSVYDSNGIKVILHKISGLNTGISPILIAASAPIRYEQINTGAAASSSQMSVGSMGVLTQSRIREQNEVPHIYKGFVRSGAVTVNGPDIPAISCRSTLSVNGLGNRQPIIPSEISIYTDQPISFKWMVGGSLTAASFALDSADDILEIDTSATAISGGDMFDTHFLAPGSHNIKIGDHFSWLNYYISILADGTYGDNHSIIFDKVGASDATVYVSFKWIEFR